MGNAEREDDERMADTHKEKPWTGFSGQSGEPLPRVRGLAAVQDALNPVPRMGPRPTAHEVIAERGSTHGDFDDNAALSQALKDTIRGFQRKDGTYPWEGFTPAMKDSLDMFCAKIGRIGAGRPDFRDHWADIAGYATLVADRCPD